jgi:hypothetical protein
MNSAADWKNLLGALKRSDRVATDRKESIKASMDSDERTKTVLKFIADHTIGGVSHRTILKRTNIDDPRYVGACRWFTESHEFSAWCQHALSPSNGMSGDEKVPQVLWANGPSKYFPVIVSDGRELSVFQWELERPQ